MSAPPILSTSKTRLQMFPSRPMSTTQDTSTTQRGCSSSRPSSTLLERQQGLKTLDDGEVHLNSNASLWETIVVWEVLVETLHIHDRGTFELHMPKHSPEFRLEATNITICGGGHFRSGGASGSIWITCLEIVGHGSMSPTGVTVKAIQQSVAVVLDVTSPCSVDSCRSLMSAWQHTEVQVSTVYIEDLNTIASDQK
ncbi:hypothetical protein LSAT2_017271 [Lamellibrachia satsuma]|nr:hypothetical protein LSAT2_017271 [Lamellibrachia satsuma]